MTEMGPRLKTLWEILQNKKRHMPFFLTELGIDGLRGLSNLRVKFDYPVSVVAGSNATGKSTVLFAAACAYEVPGAGSRDYIPSTLFPNYYPKTGNRIDTKKSITLTFEHDTPDGHLSMQWRRHTKNWTRSYFGREGASQPARQVYFRTLSNLSNPSEVRSVLSMSRLNIIPQETSLTPVQKEFAQLLLPFNYDEVVDLSSQKKSLLFAELEDGTGYSELHMSAGERYIIRLSQEIAQLENALVLIDEVESGLHPLLQQQLMLEMQQLAVRNGLQIIVTTHSPTVLDCVPTAGRIFLARNDSGDVVVQEPYRDIIQDALYGRYPETLNILCEDETAEGVLNGVLDHITSKEDIKWDSVRIGRDTGGEEFPMHAKALGRFGPVEKFVFVLDGDKRETDIRAKIYAHTRNERNILYLPGSSAPEVWVWDKLSALDTVFGIPQATLAQSIRRLNSLYGSASGSPSSIAKSKLHGLAEKLKRRSVDICREVARLEAGKSTSDIRPMVEKLTNILNAWRTI